MLSVATLALLAALPAAAADAAGCPRVPYPPGPPAGAQRVEGALAIDAQGRVAGLQATGDPRFVAAVEATLGACAFEAGEPRAQPYAWDFPVPPPNVVGVVRARGDQRVVPGATVVLVDGWGDAVGAVVKTAADGSFTLANVAPGVHALRVDATGFRLPATQLDVPENAAISAEVWLIPERAEDDALVATYTAQPLPGAEVHTLSLDLADATPGSLGDVVRAIHRDPAFARAPFDAGWLLVRGGDYDDTGLFVDGVAVPLLFHLGGFTSILHPALTSGIAFWPDTPPVRYGGSLSGAVDLKLSPLPEQFRVLGGMNLVFAHAFAEGPIDSGTLQVAARRSYLDGVLSLALGPESAQIAPRFWDAEARWGNKRADVLLLVVSDVFDAPTGEGDEVVEIARSGGQLQANLAVVPNRLKFSPHLAFRDQSLSGAIMTQSVSEWFPGGRLEWTPDPEDFDVLVGVEGDAHTFTLVQGGERRSAPLETGAVYAQASAEQGALEAHAGLRLEGVYIPGQLFRGAVSPQVGTVWHATRALAFAGELGRAHQTPDPILLVGLPDGEYLTLEQGDAVSFGPRLDLGRARLRVTGWDRATRGLAGFEEDGSLGTLRGQARGVETELAADVAGFSGTVVYAYTWARRFEVPGGTPILLAQDQPHRFEVDVLRPLPRGWQLSARFRYSSGFPRPATDEVFDVLTQELVQVDFGANDRLQPFHALDVQLRREFVFRKWRLDAYLDVQNVYNRRVPEPVITGFGESDPAFGFGLPVLPIFGVEGVFWP